LEVPPAQDETERQEGGRRNPGRDRRAGPFEAVPLHRARPEVGPGGADDVRELLLLESPAPCGEGERPDDAAARRIGPVDRVETAAGVDPLVRGPEADED